MVSYDLLRFTSSQPVVDEPFVGWESPGFFLFVFFKFHCKPIVSFLRSILFGFCTFQRGMNLDAISQSAQWFLKIVHFLASPCLAPFVDAQKQPFLSLATLAPCQALSGTASSPCVWWHGVKRHRPGGPWLKRLVMRLEQCHKPPIWEGWT